MTKQLQQDSKYNRFDSDGDGIVTDQELARSERMIQIENNDRMADQQRMMAWVAMWSTIVAVIALLSPFVSLDRVVTASAFLNTFLVAQTGIVIGFMGATAFAKRKENE
jgi:predicted tellurium resistance membrane protein TerC